LRRALALVVALVVLSPLAAACGGDEANERAGATSTTTSTSTSTTTTTSSSATSTTTSTSTSTTTSMRAAAASTTAAAPARPALASVRIGLARVGVFDQPLDLKWCAGHAHPFVAEKGGRIRRLDGRQVLDITGAVSSSGEQGLLGIACSPDGRFLYVDYTDRNGDERLDEYPLPASDVLDPRAARNLLTIPDPAPNHNGGGLLFGPDGKLWYALGDGGGAGDQYDNAQNRNTLLGKLVRIDPRPAGGRPYSSPADNPFARGGGRPEIAVYGLRNPWRFSFDRATGDLWIGDVGQGRVEEIDRLPAGRILGANLGWPYFEGTHRYRSGNPPAGAIGPVFQYGRDQGQAVVGGYVYRGGAIPALRGAYVYTDTYEPSLRAIVVEGGRVTQSRDLGVRAPGLVASFAEGPSGELYVLSLSGGIYRIDRR
jgi:glucose/arabinose dehydrogenase